MYSDELEKEFGAYLDSDQCEKLSALFFETVRSSFAAGWQAALRTQAPSAGETADGGKSRF